MKSFWSKLSAPLVPPFSTLDLLFMGGALGLAAGWIMSPGSDVSLFTSLSQAVLGAGIALFLGALVSLFVRPPRVEAAPTIPFGAELLVVLDDAHLLEFVEEGTSSRLRVSSSSVRVEVFGPDGASTPAPGLRVPPVLEVRLPALLPAEAREALASGLPGSLTVWGRFSPAPSPSFKAEQLVVDFPLWAESYL